MELRNRGAKLGILIQQARQAKGLSTRQLGAAIGTTHSYIHKLEAGWFQSISPENVQKSSGFWISTRRTSLLSPGTEYLRDCRTSPHICVPNMAMTCPMKRLPRSPVSLTTPKLNMATAAPLKMRLRTPTLEVRGDPACTDGPEGCRASEIAYVERGLPHCRGSGRAPSEVGWSRLPAVP